MRPIFLIGFMASGKSTLGRALAGAKPRLRFVDLDEAIETREGCSVAEIFAARGQDAFRKLESAMLRELAADDTVIACGGGTPCRRENMDFMLERGTVVRLEASTDTIVRRLAEAPRGQRPLVDGLLDEPEALKAHVEKMLAEREEAYGRSQHSFNADRLETVSQVSRAVDEFCRRFLTI